MTATGKCHGSAGSGVQGQSNFSGTEINLKNSLCHPTTSTGKIMAGQDTTVLPLDAAAAVFQHSEPVPADTVVVEGPNFDQSIDLQDLLSNYNRIGFQASSLGRAIDIVNKMVSLFFPTVYFLS